jgi:hypothetical protein
LSVFVAYLKKLVKCFFHTAAIQTLGRAGTGQRGGGRLPGLDWAKHFGGGKKEQ